MSQITPGRVDTITAPSKARTGTGAAGRRRCGVWAGVVTLTLAVAACSSDGRGSERSSDTSRSGSSTTAAPVDEPPDGGQVRVVDYGYTVFPGPARPGTVFAPEAEAAGQTYDVVSWGIVVENTSEWIATYTEIRVNLVDSTGAVVPTDGEYEWPGAETVVLLRPGERYGMGHTDALQSPADRSPGNVPAELQVELGSSQWFPPDTDLIEPGELTTTDVRTGHGTGTEAVDFLVDFMAESTYEHPQQASATAVFRDATGRTIGGTSRWNDSHGYEPDRTLQAIGEPTPGSISINYTVPNVADAQSDVYLAPATIDGIPPPE